jgi:hypothetical protein
VIRSINGWWVCIRCSGGVGSGWVACNVGLC